MKIICSGGLGDAVMILGKLRSPQLINKDIHITHVHRNGILNKEIAEFYSFFKINAKIINEDFSWIDENRANYDMELYSGWYGEIEINPFPEIEYKKVNADIVICLVAGQRRDRKINTNGLEDFVKDKKITYIGNGETLTEAINIICSANIIISPEGFVTWMGGLAGKKVFICKDICTSKEKYNLLAIEEHRHPKWDVKLFSNFHELLRYSQKREENCVCCDDGARMGNPTLGISG